MDKKEYIKVLTDQIRCKMARPAVAREIGDHIEDQAMAFMSEGMNRAEAEAAAVKEMGNPVETGVELDSIHRPKMPWLMIGLIVMLSAVSCVFQVLLNQEAVKAGIGEFFDSRRQIVFILTGILVMTGVCFADYTRIASCARELMTGSETDGLMRWCMSKSCLKTAECLAEEMEFLTFRICRNFLILC